jgi:hypothetical protein
MGVAAGIALQEKYLIAFWLAGLGIGLIATPARRVFRAPSVRGSRYRRANCVAQFSVASGQ